MPHRGAYRLASKSQHRALPPKCGPCWIEVEGPLRSSTAVALDAQSAITTPAYRESLAVEADSCSSSRTGLC